MLPKCCGIKGIRRFGMFCVWGKMVTVIELSHHTGTWIIFLKKACTRVGLFFFLFLLFLFKLHTIPDIIHYCWSLFLITTAVNDLSHSGKPNIKHYLLSGRLNVFVIRFVQKTWTVLHLHNSYALNQSCGLILPVFTVQTHRPCPPLFFSL